MTEFLYPTTYKRTASITTASENRAPGRATLRWAVKVPPQSLREKRWSVFLESRRGHLVTIASCPSHGVEASAVGAADLPLFPRERFLSGRFTG